MNRKALVGTVIGTFIILFFYISINKATTQVEIENAPDWVKLEDAFEMIETGGSGKLILVDIYEIGCRFCRRMEREVYPSESIRTLIDRSFIPVKVNGNSDAPLRFRGEEMTEQQFASLTGVTAFPYTVVLDSDGNILNTRRGYMGVSDLSRFLNNTLDEFNSVISEARAEK